jgi:hypothetical protein
MRKKKYGRIGSSESGCINFCRRIHRQNISSVIPPTILTVNRTRHRTELPFWIPRWFRRHFHRWTDLITVRSWCFESLGDSVGKKIPIITSTSANCPLFLILNILLVSPSVNTDGCFPSVCDDDITDRLNAVGNGDLKWPTELFRRQIRWY